MRTPLLVLILLSLRTISFGQTCKSNQYDMLDWMAPQQPTVGGHYNILYPTTGTFYWVKSSKGYPWDVDTFDAKYIYQSITAQVWNDPTTYKIFQTPLPWMPRCIGIPAVPGKLASITVDATKTWLDIHTSCTSFTSHDLGYSVNEVWGPYNTAIGSLPAAPTLVLVVSIFLRQPVQQLWLQRDVCNAEKERDGAVDVLCAGKWPVRTGEPNHPQRRQLGNGNTSPSLLVIRRVQPTPC